MTSSEWNPSGIVFPGKGTYTVVQTVGNTVGTYVSQLKINIMGTPEVTFESNGGSSVPMQTVKVGNKAIEPAQPTKDGYTFGGWYKESSLLNRYSFDQPVTQHMTLYAKWIPGNGGNSGSNDGGNTPDNGNDSNGNDSTGKDDGTKDTGKTSDSASALMFGSIAVDNSMLSIIVLLFGGVLAYFGNRNQNDRMRTIGIAVAALAAMVLVFGIDVIGLFGSGGN